jgi:hypothetical protein
MALWSPSGRPMSYQNTRKQIKQESCSVKSQCETYFLCFHLVSIWNWDSGPCYQLIWGNKCSWENIYLSMSSLLITSYVLSLEWK